MDFTELLEPVLTNGIRVNNFFNGRVLTAEDLRAEQQANRAQHRQLALALGEGVANGLEVRAGTADDGTPVLTVSPGLAFTREGDAVALGREARVRLVAEARAAEADAGLFAVCRPRSDTLELTDVGLWILSASPASGLSAERAPVVELEGDGVAGACASRWAQEGARFSVAPLPLAAAGTTPTPLAAELAELVEDVEEDVERVLRGGASDTPAVRERLARTLSVLRSGAAYLCFGADTLAERRASPLADDGFPDARHGAVDGMRGRGEVKGCEVPLALFYLSARGIEWVDAWAVRRPPVPALTAGALSVLPGSRGEAEAVAMLLQFQAHADDLAGSGLTGAQLIALQARQWFRFLPPVGLLPTLGPGATRGFGAAAFLAGYATGSPAQLPGSQVERVIRDALLGPPLDLSARGAALLYRSRENLPGGGRTPAPVVVFVNREAQPSRQRDPVAQVFQQTWTVYRGLLKRRVFLPLDAGNDASAARIAITTAVQDVMATALQNATLAAGGRLPTSDVPDGFLALHSFQEELGVLLQTGIAGVPDTQNRAAFAAQLRGLLNTAVPGGPSLRAAATQGDVLASVRAQEIINQFVGSWSGEGVAMGFIDVTYAGSPDGDTLVQGSPDTFEYRFQVANHTDKSLTIELTPSATGGGAAASGTAADWTAHLQVRAARGGQAISEVALAPAASVDVFVAVTVPPGAQAGPVTLTLLAATGAPHNKSDTAQRTLTVGAEPTAPVTRSIEIVSITPAAANATVTAGQMRTWDVILRYDADEGPEQAQFRLALTGTAPSAGQAAEWAIGFFGGTAATGTTATRTAETTRTLPAGQNDPMQLRLQVRAPTSAGGGPKTLQLRFRAESVDLPAGEQISVESATWTLTLPAP